VKKIDHEGPPQSPPPSAQQAPHLPAESRRRNARRL